MRVDLGKFLENKQIELQFNGEVVLNELQYSGKKMVFDEPVEVSGSLYLVDVMPYINLEINYKFVDTCDRCLKSFPNVGVAHLSARILREPQEENEDYEEILMCTEDCIIELDNAVKEAIVLSLPLKSLCSESCKGLCIRCGTNLNEDKCSCHNEVIDERFAKLKELLQ